MKTRSFPGVAPILLALFLLLPGCGEDEQTVTTTVTEQTADTAQAEPVENKPKSNPKPKPEPLTLAEQAEGVVADYYAAVDSSLYGQAWKLLSPTLQQSEGGFEVWKAGYATTLETKATGINAISASEQSAVVELGIKAVDADVCGKAVDQTFAGTWQLAWFDGEFLGTAFDVAKTGGTTPITDPAACTSGGGGVSLTPSGCDPNYSGCVPPYPPDVDCLDLREEVDVIGEDVHNLDIEGDGEACEVFFE
jgi:hypothetical protein